MSNYSKKYKLLPVNMLLFVLFYWKFEFVYLFTKYLPVFVLNKHCFYKNKVIVKRNARIVTIEICFR